MKRLALMMLVACDASAPPLPRGPVHTFVVDDFTLPTNNVEARALGCDLDGDGGVENQLGMTIGLQASEGNITPYVADLIGSGALESYVTLQTEDLGDASVAGARFIGHASAPSVQAVGHIEGGVFATDGERAGAGVVRLPVLIDADVAQLQVNRMRIALTPDGAGGFDGIVCGAVDHAEAREDAARAQIQMVRNNPADHPYAIAIFDTNRDGAITTQEVMTNTLFTSLFSADLELEGRDMVSLGFGVHLAPCEGATCPTPPAPVNRCDDRMLGGDESDVDCGGTSCLRCAGGLACAAPSDCASNACDAGMCREPTCTDGAWDGFESDVDCGWNCAKCAAGKMCERGDDCASFMCVAKVCQ